MSSTLQSPPADVTGPNAAAPGASLAALRAELDQLDDALHDLLMRRAEVVERVAATGAKGGVAMRPGREASIVRRLLARHSGRLAHTGILRIWRELISANTGLQGPFSVAVCEADPTLAFTAAAREHFGALTPLRTYRSPAQAIREVSAGLATAAILPMPAEGEPPSAAWWTALLHRDDPRIHVVARLPFWTPRPEGAPKAQALVVSAAMPDPSGLDRSLLGLEIALDVSRARLAADLAAGGFAPGVTILRRDPGSPVAYALVDVDGFVTDADPRLPALKSVLRPPIVLGAYAVPLAGGNS
jgi:chorismate mutase/prephenate dehydratase